MTGRVVVLRGDAANLPLADESVDLIVTSPPYFGLRSYIDAGEHYAGQIGGEATPGEYIANLLACTREWVRVLKPEGSLFVNLGDKFAQRPGQFGPQGTTGARATRRQSQEYADIAASRAVDYGTAAPKSLLGLPWRYVIGCTDQLGLILRRDIIWSKPNAMPESATDRCRSSHEYLFHLVKQDRYFAAMDEIRELHVATATGRNTRNWKQGASGNREIGRGHWEQTERDFGTSPLGKLPGSVWEIPSVPLAVPPTLGVDHFAAYPPELVRRIVLGWSPSGICAECGEGRRPVVRATRPGTGRLWNDDGRGVVDQVRRMHEERTHRELVGYACACPNASAPVRPGVVVDPFGGTGTTALVASAHRRTGVTVDRSADYCRIARWRTSDPAERARALGVPKPPPVPDGQGSLFDEREVS